MHRLLKLALALVLLGPLLVSAQTTVYKQRDAQGRLIFSDRPISRDAQTTSNRPASGPAAAEAAPTLPTALRDIMSRYPVTIYTAKDCQPCDNGRALLMAKGIPFSERTVLTPEDGQALTRLSGSLTVPVLTIGNEQLKGYSESSWTDYLAAAGYPAQSSLPAGYRNPEPRPMVDIRPTKEPSVPQPIAPATTPAPLVQPAGPSSQNPAGIIF